MRISDLAQGKALSINLVNTGETLTFRRKPLTDDFVESWAGRGASDEESVVGFILRALPNLLQSWDVTDENGHPVEPTPDVLATMDRRDREAMFLACMADLIPPTIASASSDAGSQAPEMSEPPQSGIRDSGPPETAE